MSYKYRINSLHDLKYSNEEIRSVIFKEILDIDKLIFNKLESYYCDKNYDEYQEIIEIIKSQQSNINFTNKYLKNIPAKSIETIFKDRIILFINFIKELKSTLKYIFNQNSPFTTIQVNSYRKNNFVLSEKSLDIQLLLNNDVAEYLEIIDKKNNLNFTYKTKDYQRLKKLDEKIPEIIYFLNNISLNNFDENSINIQSISSKIETIDNLSDSHNISSATNQEHKETHPSLHEILKLAIKNNIAELYGNVYLTHLYCLENILYKKENNTFNVDISVSESKKLFTEYVESNLLIVKKLFNLITRITSNFTEINSVLKDDGDEFIYHKADIINLNELFTDILHIDLYYVRIIDQQKFNETKDEIEFLYEAYDKLYTDITGNVFDTQSITIEKTLLKEKIEEPEIAEQIEKSDNFDNATDNNIQSELKKIKTNLEDNLKTLNSLIITDDINESRNNNENIIDKNLLFSLINEEKYRLGSPIVNQFVENLKKRINDLI
jgi:hypothetical protein